MHIEFIISWQILRWYLIIFFRIRQFLSEYLEELVEWVYKKISVSNSYFLFRGKDYEITFFRSLYNLRFYFPIIWYLISISLEFNLYLLVFSSEYELNFKNIELFYSLYETNISILTWNVHFCTMIPRLEMWLWNKFHFFK